jgi:hypothetical protein
MWVGGRSRNVVISDKKNDIYHVKSLYTRHKNYVLHKKIGKKPAFKLGQLRLVIWVEVQVTQIFFS